MPNREILDSFLNASQMPPFPSRCEMTKKEYQWKSLSGNSTQVRAKGTEKHLQ